MTVYFYGTYEMYKVAVVFGFLTVLFWGLTYAYIFLTEYKYRASKKLCIPLVVSILCIGWEACTCYYWKYPCKIPIILCFIVNLIIVLFRFSFFSSLKQKIIYVLLLLLSIFSFYHILPLKHGFVYSGYALDLFLSILFLINRKKINPHNKLKIAIYRTIGSFFAIFVFCYGMPFVVIVQSTVLILNIIYIYLCIKEQRN